MYFKTKTTLLFYIKHMHLQIKMDPVDEEILKLIERINMLLDENIMAVRLRIWWICWSRLGK